MRVGRQLLYASTISAIALGARSVMRGPVPLSVSLSSIAAFTAIVLLGVVEPRLGMFADVVVRGARSPDAPRVALTFDDGPGIDTTPRVLDLLDQAGARGTFFVVGKKLLDPRRASILRDAHARGHAVGCHSFGHDRLFALRSGRYVRDDLERALSAIEGVIGERPKIFRPPIGHTNPTIARVAEELGLEIVGFSVRGYDGVRSARGDKVARRIVRGLDDGAIALLHDSAERDDFTPSVLHALPSILAACKERSLSAVTIPELLAPPATSTATLG